MFHTKFLLTVTFLIVVTIIHHNFAMQPYAIKCAYLMQGFWFENEKSDGKDNFQMAFNNLTIKQMDIYLDQWYQEVIPHNPHPGETLQVQGALLKDYYLNLFSDHGIEHEFYGTLDPMAKWCVAKVAEVLERSGIKEHFMDNCMKAIKIKFGFTEADTKEKIYKTSYEKWIAHTSMERIYKTFYEEWTLIDLRTVRNTGDDYGPMESSRRIDTENTEDLVNNYPYHFFRYYEETIRLKGKFRTIEEYCDCCIPIPIKDRLRALP